MKKLLFVIFLLTGLSGFSQNYLVTFQVDMREVGVISDTICVVGDFQADAGYSYNWTPGVTIMTDPNTDSIYSITVSIPAGTYEYKFVNGKAWGFDETVPASCSNLGNRQITISSDITLPVVCYSSCSPCASAPIFYSVTFSVDMSAVSTIESTVSITGDFQSEAGYGADWTPGLANLTDPNMDSIYEISIIIPQGYYNYKFVNGSAWGQDETVPVACASSGNREILVSNDTVLSTVCYSSCDPCADLGVGASLDPVNSVIYNDDRKVVILMFKENLVDNISIDVFDVNGRLMSSTSTFEKSATVSTDKLNSGVYFIRVISGKYSSSIRVVLP